MRPAEATVPAKCRITVDGRSAWPVRRKQRQHDGRARASKVSRVLQAAAF